MITDWETFFNDVRGENVYNVRVLKRKFTPYEREKKLADESCWEYIGDFYFCDSIELPNGDVLIGMKMYNYAEEKESRTEYYKLSEIRFTDVTEEARNNE